MTCQTPSTEESSTAALNGLNLGHVNGCAVEASGKLAAVEVGSLGSLDGAESGAGSAADARLGANRLTQGAVLLGVVTVGAEAGVGVARARAEVGGERAGGGSRVRLRAVVDVGC